MLWNCQDIDCKHLFHDENRRCSQPPLPVEAQLSQDPSASAAAASPFCVASMSERRSARNPKLAHKLEQMALRVMPLFQITTGHVHPAFPKTLLQFWLLTDDQLESLAHFYHQRTPSVWTCQYPCPVRWGPRLTLEEKRRKMGRFIGIGGCESPIVLRTAEELLDEARWHAAMEEDAENSLKYRFR
ncbi:hypothetical protein RB594_006561 [Gaeumannomyces avenae]